MLLLLLLPSFSFSNALKAFKLEIDNGALVENDSLVEDESLIDVGVFQDDGSFVDVGNFLKTMEPWLTRVVSLIMVP